MRKRSPFLTIVIIGAAAFLFGLLFYKKSAPIETVDAKSQLEREDQEDEADGNEDQGVQEDGLINDSAVSSAQKRKNVSLPDILRSLESLNFEPNEIEESLKRINGDEKILLAAGLILLHTPEGKNYIKESFAKSKTNASYLAMILADSDNKDLISEFKEFAPNNFAAALLELNIHPEEDVKGLIMQLAEIKGSISTRQLDFDQDQLANAMATIFQDLGYEQEAAEAMASLRVTNLMKWDMMKPIYTAQTNVIAARGSAANQLSMSDEEKIQSLEVLNFFMNDRPTLFDEMLITNNNKHIAELKNDLEQVKNFDNRERCDQVINIQYKSLFSDLTYNEAKDYFKTSKNQGELQALLNLHEVRSALEQEKCLSVFADQIQH